jgi:hypothetical protein
MPLSFPASPTVGQQSTQNGRVYSWTGYAWELVAASGGGGLSWSSVPASSTATGTAGQIAYDVSGRFYLCTATNTWRRTTLSSWVSDSYWSDVVLMMHGDGSFTDSSSYARTATAVGDANANGTARFGSGSLSFDGNGDYLTIPTSTSLDLGNTYTVECWIHPASSSLTGGVVSRALYYASGNGGLSSTWDGLNFSIRGMDSFMRFYFYGTTAENEQYVDVSQSSFPANTWTHLAMVRNGTSGQIYANGSQVGSISSLGNTSASSQPLLIGTWKYLVSGNDTFAGYWNGRIDDLRITKGVARTITVPTAAYPDE